MPVSLNKNTSLNDISLLPFWSLSTTHSPSGEERKVWFKVLHEPYALDANLVRLYQEAARQTAGLDHPNILKIYEFGVENSIPYVAHEVFDGKTLRQVFTRARTMSPQTVLRLIYQIALALQYAHLHGVLHGALNLDNILVNANNVVKVLNWGHAKISHFLVHDLADEKSIRFAHYFSPEQARKRNIDGRSDIYSLGIIFYHLLTGQLPYSASTLEKCLQVCGNAVPKHPMMVNSAIQADLDQLVMQMLTTEPDERISNATSVLRRLEPYGYMAPGSDTESDSADFEVHRGPKFLPAWLAQHLPRSLTFLSPALVGSQRRLALAIMTISAVLILIIGVITLTGLFTGHKSDMFLYYDWLAEEEAAASKAEVDRLPTIYPRAPETQIQSKLVRPTQPLNDYGSDTGLKQISVGEAALPQIGVKTTDPVPVKDGGPGRREDDRSGLATAEPKPQSGLGASTRAPIGALRIIATVDGKPALATVLIDGVAKGKTSAQGALQVGQLSARVPHAVRVVKEGFNTWESTFDVFADSIRTVRAELSASAPSGRRFTFAQVSFADRISINGKGSFRLPASIELLPGLYQVHYVHSGTGFTWTNQLQVEANTPEVISFNAELLGQGFLTVSIKNAAEYGYGYVRLDGEAQHRGATPTRLKLTAGPHHVKLSRDGFKAIPSDTTVIIKKGEETFLFFLLKPE